MISEIRSCPFCGGKNIEISVKRKATSRGDKHHVCCYCKDCYTYGPRILVDDEKDGIKYGWLHEANLPENIKQKAIDAWNSRT